jgi:hypothetical protein
MGVSPALSLRLLVEDAARSMVTAVLDPMKLARVIVTTDPEAVVVVAGYRFEPP